MKQLKYHIKTLSSILITSNTGDPNMVATKEYISGIAILGAFAGIYIRKNTLNKPPHDDDNFRKWFLNGSLKFTNAYIVTYDDKNIAYCSKPIPVSVQKDKDDENSIYDLLHFDLNGPQNSNGDDIITKRIDGFGTIDNGSLYEQKIKKSLNFHHERSPDSGTTKEIFNYESIDAGQTFEGTIIGEENELKTLCTSFGQSFETNIGRSRSAQYGRIHFEFIGSPKEISVNATTNGISLTLLSDTIIYNEQGFSTTDEKDFKKALKENLGNSVEINKSFIKTGEVENFVFVWKLRKPSETCLSAGSCFLISGVNDVEKLKELQINGIGERTHEGFGRVAVGIQTNTQLTKRDYGEACAISGIIPTLAKEIAKGAVRNYIRKSKELDALMECSKFNIKPLTKSLISRLEMAVKSNQKKELNRKIFIEYLERLRETAEDKLRKCHNGNDTLLDFLKKKEVSIDNNIESVIENICKEIAFQLKEDTDFMNSLYKSYFETFFSAMRKAKKTEKEG